MITEEYLIEQFTESRWNPIEVTCPDGAKMYITPCAYEENISNVSQVEYFLVDGDLPWLGCDTITQLVHQINNHAEMVIESEKEKKEVQEYYEKYSKLGWPDDSFGFYSDWHKDVYGFRPSRKTEPGIYVDPYYR